MSSTKLKHTKTKLRFSQNTKLMLLAALIGVGASLGAGAIRFIPKWSYTRIFYPLPIDLGLHMQ